MALFSKKSGAGETHHIEVHFAQPMTERMRKHHEAGITELFLPRLKTKGTVLPGQTSLSATEEPVSSDIRLEVHTSNPTALASALAEVLTTKGLGRGSWIGVDGKRTAAGTSEYVLLRTRLAAEADSDLQPTVTALQRALGDGDIGWNEDVYYRFDGPVFVFNGDSAQEILEVLRVELTRQPLLRHAELVAFDRTAS